MKMNPTIVKLKNKDMKTSYLHRLCLGAALVFVLIGCSSSPPGGGSFIPGFNATWPVQGDNNRQIDLQPNEANKNVPHGVFNGEEIFDNDTIRNPLSGSFNGLNIEFTIQRPNHHSVQYTGTMTPISEVNHFITRIELHSSEGSMVLAR